MAVEDIKETTILKCPKCKKEFLPCDFRHTKCSENYCGSYYAFICPECHVSVKPKDNEIGSTDYTILLTNLLNNKSDAEDCDKSQYRHQEQIFDTKGDNLYQNKDSYAPFLENW